LEPNVNLKEIREEINSALDYNPELKQYDDRLTRVINRHYLQISSQYQWLFMQKRHVFTLRKDITAGSADALVSDGGRVVTLSTSTGAGVKNLPTDIVGNTLVIDNTHYLITHYRNARSFIVDSPVPVGNHTSWTIEYVTYPMPRDSIEIMGVMDRGIKKSETISYSTDSTTSTLTGPNRGRFMFLDARKEEYLYLDRADTGEPFVSIEEMHSSLRPPDFAPEINLVKGGVTTSTDITAIRGATYEYCYTFTYAGKESPPSPVASATIPSEGKTLMALTRLMDTSATYSDSSLDTGTGRYKKIYRRVSVKPQSIASVPPDRLDTGMGPWRHIATVKESNIEYIDTFAELSSSTVMSGLTFDSSISPSGDLFDLGHLNEIGPRQYLRFWYTPKSDYPVEARYHRRPLRLVNDADCPEWPVQYHHYLVYAALKDISMQHGMATYSQLYEARAQQLMERMKSKYLSRTDRMYVRRGFDRAMADRERFGIPSKS